MDGLAPTSVEPGKAEALPPAPKTTVKLLDRVYDLIDAFPITLGDWEALEAMGIMNARGAVAFTASKMVTDCLFHFLHKLNPEITRELVMTLPLRELPALQSVIGLMIDKEEAAYKENPTQRISSTQSTS